MPYFKKVTDAEGKDTYEEVADDKLQLPATHPLVVSLEKTKAESIARRHKLDAIKGATDEDDDQESEEDEPTTSKPVTAKPVKPAKQTASEQHVPTAKEIAQEAAQILRDEARTASETQNARRNAVDLIMKETGLDPALRGTVEAIPDLAVAKQQALVLAKRGLRFDPTPVGENGEQDVTGLTGKAAEQLAFVDRKKK